MLTISLHDRHTGIGRRVQQHAINETENRKDEEGSIEAQEPSVLPAVRLGLLFENIRRRRGGARLASVQAVGHDGLVLGLHASQARVHFSS